MMTLTLMMTNEEEQIDPSLKHLASCGHKDRAKQKRHEHRHTHAMYRKVIGIIHAQKNQWRRRRRKFFLGDRQKLYSGYLEEGEGGGGGGLEGEGGGLDLNSLAMTSPSW